MKCSWVVICVASVFMRSPCASCSIGKRSLMPSTVGDGYGTQLRNMTPVTNHNIGFLNNVFFFFFFFCKSSALYTFIDCTSNSEDPFDIYYGCRLLITASFSECELRSSRAQNVGEVSAYWSCVQFSGLFSTSPIMHLICPPKFCRSSSFNFSWDGCNTQEKRKTKVMQFFFGGGVGNKVHYGRCARGECGNESRPGVRLVEKLATPLDPPPVLCGLSHVLGSSSQKQLTWC